MTSFVSILVVGFGLNDAPGCPDPFDFRNQILASKSRLTWSTSLRVKNDLGIRFGIAFYLQANPKSTLTAGTLKSEF